MWGFRLEAGISRDLHTESRAARVTTASNTETLGSRWTSRGQFRAYGHLPEGSGRVSECKRSGRRCGP